MAYLAKNDYTLRIAVSHLDEILEQAIETTGLTEDNVRNNAESWAQAMIKSYLVSKYDIATEFAIDAPAARNWQIMQIMIDLSLCTLHKTINPRDIPEHISIECENAMKFLKDARDGVLVVDLDPAPETAPGQPYQRTFLESQVKFVSKPFQDLKQFDEEL